MCVCPFLCPHPRHQRDHPDQSALLFALKGQVLSPRWTLLFVPALWTPQERSLQRGPLGPSCHRALVYEPVAWKASTGLPASPSFGYGLNFRVRDSTSGGLTTPSVFINAESHQRHLQVVTTEGGRSHAPKTTDWWKLLVSFQDFAAHHHLLQKLTIKERTNQ